MALVTPQTNRTDTFAAAHGITVSQVVAYNIDYFLANRTFWLPVGEDFRVQVPLSQSGRDLLLDGNTLLVNGDRLVIT